MLTSLRKYPYSLRNSLEDGSSLLFYSTCLEVHFLAGLCIKHKHFIYTSRFQVRRSAASFVVQVRHSLDKKRAMLSTEIVKEIAKFAYLATTLTNKPGRNILLECCKHFSALIHLFICDLFNDDVSSSVHVE